jgi:Response regulators consisting of a CheY-like receiver domain and a winged-helix DNA-binding domain
MSLRVLLVEDSVADAAFAERALEVSDGEFEVTITGSLDAGIDRLGDGFDAILLDLTLPDSAGSETVVRMRAAARDVPIVVLTSVGGEGVADGCLRAGADVYRQKGHLGPTELFEALSFAIERGHRPKADPPSARGLRSL